MIVVGIDNDTAILVATQLLLVVAMIHHLRCERKAWGRRLDHIHSDFTALRKEMQTMAAITAEMLDQLLTIAEALLAADPNDKDQIAQLQAQVQALTADVADFNDPQRAARIQSFLDAAAAATPAPPEA